MAAYDPNQDDTLFDAARKILVFLNASAGSNVTPNFFSDGHTPRDSDTLWITMEKILGALIDGGGGGGGGSVQVYNENTLAFPAAPANPAGAAIYAPTNGDSWRTWNGVNWV